MINFSYYLNFKSSIIITKIKNPVEKKYKPSSMKILVNFSSDNFYKAQKFSSKMALKVGGFDRVIENNANTLGASFQKENASILTQSRGAGYWLWKPYIVLQALLESSDGDLIMYADSGSHFIASANPLFNLISSNRQDIIPFSLEHPEAHWTKRDAFILMGCDGQGFEKTPQRLASFFLARRSKNSILFFQQYLDYCKNSLILTDVKNRCYQPNYLGFKEHRHDQSVFSLLTKKYSLEAFRDPSQWGNGRLNDFTNSNYPQLIEHHRQKSPKHSKTSYKIKTFFKRIFRG